MTFTGVFSEGIIWPFLTRKEKKKGHEGEVPGFVSWSARITDLHAALHLFIKLKTFLGGVMQAGALKSKPYQQRPLWARQQHI